MEPDGAIKMDGPPVSAMGTGPPVSAMETALKDHGTSELIRLGDVEALADRPSHLILAAADPGQAVRPEALSLQIDLSENKPCPGQAAKPEAFSLQVDLSQNKPYPGQAGRPSLQLDPSESKPCPARPEDAFLQVDLSENKACRLPRWSRHETLVLIEAKKEGEARVKKPKEEREKNEKNKPVNESKWLFISAVCKKRGVDREANQCRKRWGNLFGDYKRIKDWQMEASTNNGAESFWLMRNDERKENKLPGSFDPEVFEALESFLGRKAGAAPALAPAPAAAVEAEAVFESGRPASEEGLVSDIEHPAQEEYATHDAARGAGSSTPDPDSCKEQSPYKEQLYKEQSPSKEQSYKEQSPTHSNGRKKRKRPFLVESEQPKDQLVALLENNCKVLSEHIEAQNRNNQLDRAQRKDQVDSLVRVLGKLADALEKISEKLKKHDGCA